MEEAINLDLFVRNKRHEDCPEEANHSNKYNLVSNRDKIKVEKLDWCPNGVVRFVLGPISQWGISKGPWAMDKKHLPTTDHPVRVQATLT